MDSNISTTYFINFIALLLVVLPIFYLTKSAFLKRALLILTGMALLFFIAPRLSLFYFILSICTFIAQNIIVHDKKPKLQLFLLWVFILSALMPIILWKFYPEHFTIQFNLKLHQIIWVTLPWIGEIDAFKQIIIPVGISFVSFRIIDLLVRSYLGVTARLSFDRIMFYIFFPAVLIIGPVIEYGEIEKEGNEPSPYSVDNIISGLGTILLGFFKIFILAAFTSTSALIFNGYEETQPLKVWGMLFIFMWYFYFNFSGFSDLAIGISRLFGFKLKKNFNYPFFKTNIKDFWANWHMSLTSFAMRNVYTPMGGYRKKKQYQALICTMLVIGLWHDLSLSFLLFGSYHAIGLCIHRYWSDKRTSSSSLSGGVINTFITFIFVTLSFPMVVLPFDKLISFYQKLFFIL